MQPKKSETKVNFKFGTGFFVFLGCNPLPQDFYFFFIEQAHVSCFHTTQLSYLLSLHDQNLYAHEFLDLKV